jgi:hypothetical protein
VPTAQSRVRLAFDKLKAELAAPDLAALQEANDW